MAPPGPPLESRMSVSSSSLLLIYFIFLLCYLQESHYAVYLRFPTLSTKLLLYRYIHCKLQQLVAKEESTQQKSMFTKKDLKLKTKAETKNISKLKKL